jgi:hypothetical protein
VGLARCAAGTEINQEHTGREREGHRRSEIEKEDLREGEREAGTQLPGGDL